MHTMASEQSTVREYGYCDSFFVESEDETVYSMHVQLRERARVLAKTRQRFVAAELSRVTSDEYLVDVLEYMERMETETLPDVNAIDIQTEIKWFMRPYLLDFLIESHAAFQLLPETLFLAVNLLDRYCSKRIVYKRHYQLVGCAALLIAAKYGDKKERVPSVRELRSMCCNLYDEEMFTQMERHVLQTIDWSIGHPTVDAFLQIALSEVAYDPEVEHMTWYICEIALFHKEFVSTMPSVLARSALAVARCILARGQLRQSEWATTYDYETVMMLANHLYQPSHVLQRKYASMHLSGVSSTVEGFLQRQAQIARRFAPPSPPVQVGATEAQTPVQGTSLAPETPQKNQFGAIMQHGCLTPPITPDVTMFGPTGYGKNYRYLPNIFPATPSSAPYQAFPLDIPQRVPTHEM